MPTSTESKTTNGNGHARPQAAEKLDHRQLLAALRAFKRGDFSAKLREDLTGVDGQIAETFNELLFKIVLEDATPLEQVAPDVDRAFAALVQRAMAREPDHRFQSAAEFRQAYFKAPNALLEYELHPA